MVVVELVVVLVLVVVVEMVVDVVTAGQYVSRSIVANMMSNELTQSTPRSPLWHSGLSPRSEQILSIAPAAFVFAAKVQFRVEGSVAGGTQVCGAICPRNAAATHLS